VIAVLAVLGLFYLGGLVFSALAFALLMLALTAPVMVVLERNFGRILAYVLTLTITIVIAGLVVSLALWAGRSIAGWITANIDRLAAAYRAFELAMAEGDFGFEVILPDRFEPRWILGPISATLGALQSFGGFAILVLSYYALGLFEIAPMAKRLERIEAKRPSHDLRAIVLDMAGRVRYYLGLWSVIGMADAALCYLLFRIIGLEEPFAWAVFIYILNYIPFLGPLIIAILLTAFSAAQFGSFWMVVLATGGTSAINILLGSYVQPLIAGRAISISPVLLLFSVLFWSLIWDLIGAFLGVSITIALLAACSAIPSLSWISDLFMDVKAPTKEKSRL